MFKRICALLLGLMLLPAVPAAAAEAEVEPSHILVAYFSRAGENYNVGVVEKGNTALLAEIIAEQTGADMFAITPVTPYPESYDETLTIATEEAQTDARPEMAETLESIEQYDVIFVGYPIWWGGTPMIMYSFLESLDFAGKTVIPFNTHEGSGQGGTVEQIRTALPEANVLNGFAVRGSTAQNDAEAALAEVSAYLATDEYIELKVIEEVE